LSSLSGGIIGDLQRVLPDGVKTRTLSPGNELVLSYAEALRAISIATEHQIGLLGFEAFDVQESGFFTVDLDTEKGAANDYKCADSTHYRRNERYWPGGS
jgi:hypothetical protein